MFVDPQWSWPVILDRVAQPVQRTHAGIATPGKREGARTAGANQLIVDKVWRHPDQMEIVFFLAQNLVPSGERNQMGEAFQRHALTVVDVLMDDFL